MKVRIIAIKYAVDSVKQFPTKSIFGVWSSQRPLVTLELKKFFGNVFFLFMF